MSLFNKSQINAICEMIRATKIPQQPTNLLEQIIADADLDYLGRSDFHDIASLLFKELKHKNMSLIEADWDQIQIKFLQSHHYFTQTSLYLRKGLKKKHLQFLINKYS